MITRPAVSPLIVATACATGLACSGQGERALPEPRPAVRDSAGVGLITEVIDPAPRLELVETPTIPLAIDEGYVAAAALSADGEFYLLEIDVSRRNRAAWLSVYDREGTLVREWDADAGACEFAFRSMSLARDTIAVYYHAHCPHKNVLLAFDTEGALLSESVELLTGSDNAWRVWSTRDGWRMQRLGPDGTSVTTLDVASGGTGDTLFRHSPKREEVLVEGPALTRRVARLFALRPGPDIDPVGRIYASDSDRYEIEVLSPAGELERLIRPIWAPRRLDEGVYADWDARQREIWSRYPDGEEVIPEILEAQRDLPNPDVVPPVGRLLLANRDGLGGFLVLRQDLDPRFFRSGDPPTFDVFGSGGRYEGRFTAPDGFWPLLFHGDEIVASVSSSDGTNHVARYGIVSGH